jgi:hypothetical protein
MHFRIRARPEETLTVKLPDGKIFTVTFRDSCAHVPENVGRYLIEKGYATEGNEPNPKPEFEQTGSGHGALKPMFDPWVKDVTPPKDQPTEKPT